MIVSIGSVPSSMHTAADDAIPLTISRLENSIERKILEWELDIGPDFNTSFIARI
jgi:hypothetical protein